MANAKELADRRGSAERACPIVAEAAFPIARGFERLRRLEDAMRKSRELALDGACLQAEDR